MPSDPVQIYSRALVAVASAVPPQVVKQTGARTVELVNGSALALGAWLLVGPSKVGIVRSHRQGRAIVELAFEYAESRWGRVRTAAMLGGVAVPLPDELWSALFDAAFASSFAVGAIRQEHARTRARVPDLARQRMIVVGCSGSGKSTSVQGMLVSWCRSISARPPATRPAIVVIDPHGDYVGRVREVSDPKRFRPSLVDSLECAPAVFGAGTLTCVARDLPPRILTSAIGKLSTAQQRWADRYTLDDVDHSGLEHLLFEVHEPRWPEHFADLASDGQMSKPQIESLRTLRARMRALLAPPLFRFDGAGTWSDFFGRLESGEVVIVDVASYPAPQQTLLMVLVALALERRQQDAQRRGEILREVVLVADELHDFPGAFAHLNRIALEGRKFGIATVLGSQRVSHFPDDVLTQATAAVVHRLEGSDVRDAVRRWPALRPVEHELDKLSPGEAYLVARNIPWPISIDEPRPVRGTAARIAS